MGRFDILVMPYKVYTIYKDMKHSGFPKVSVENMCNTQLKAQEWIDAYEDTREELLQQNIVKLQKIYEDAEKTFGHAKAYQMKQRALSNVEIVKTLYLQETVKEYIYCLSFNLCGLDETKFNKDILIALMTEYPEYLDDVYVL